MCGLVEFGAGRVDAATLSRLVKAAAHRAADAVGTWVDGGVGLAHLGLVATPESVGERQPLVDGDSLVLVADARVDNRAELVRWLDAREPAGTRKSDAQLILAAYRRWGTDCAARLVGDFAFAVWDRRSRQLFAARDVMGMRSLYYRLEARRTVFATEVKQILALPDVPARVCEPMVAAHLAGAFGPLDWTFYEGIATLPPGHALLVDARGHRTWRFWDADPKRQAVHAEPEEYAEQLRELFTEAVRCRLRSVKPVGILLSGGVDSGSVASAAGWLLRGGGHGLAPGLRAYCWAFSELTECDERQISGAIAEHYGLPVTDVPADTAWPLSGYPAHGPDRDEPFMGAFQALQERALRLARDEGMGLVQLGSRGDQLVGGPIYDDLGLLLARRLADMAHDLRLHRQAAGASWPGTLAELLLRPLAVSLWPPGRVPRLRRRLASAPPAPPTWLSAAFIRRVGLADVIAASRPYPAVSGRARRQRYELIHSPGQMRVATWLERSHARFGLGFADPWSDRRLVEFVLAVPQWVIQRRGQTKRIARQAMTGVMPEPVRRCVGKTLPKPLYDLGLQERAKSTVLDLMSNTRAAAHGYLDERKLRASYAAYLAGQGSGNDLWWPLTLEMWLRQYF
ncbi:MAG: asparagine synthase-related protein [Egibacteraceae bacterium]